MSVDKLRAHFGFARTPFSNYAEAATMPSRVRERPGWAGGGLFGGGTVGIVS